MKLSNNLEQSFFQTKKVDKCMLYCYFLFTSSHFFGNKPRWNLELLYFCFIELSFVFCILFPMSRYTFYFVTFSGCMSNPQTTLFSFFSWKIKSFALLGLVVGFIVNFLNIKPTWKENTTFSATLPKNNCNVDIIWSAIEQNSNAKQSSLAKARNRIGV